MRAGDTDAYAVLVRRHAPMAMRTAVLLGAGGDAEDVVQEALVKAYRSLDRFRTDRPFRPWLLRIVANEARNAHRGVVRRSAREERATRSLPPELLDPATEVADREEKERLLAAIDRLPEAMGRVVVCRCLLDLDEASTAERARRAAGHGEVAAEPGAATAARRARHDDRRRWTMPETLEDRLAALAGDIGVDVPDGLEAAVMERVRATRARSGAGAAGWQGVFLGAARPAAWSPRPWARTIREWLGFHGVAVTSGDPVTEEPTVPPASGDVRLEEAAELAGFEPVVPGRPGRPRRGRGVRRRGRGLAELGDRERAPCASTSSAGGSSRSSGRPRPTRRTPRSRAATRSGSRCRTRSRWSSPDGDVRDLPSRLAAPTLVWLDGDLTLRLEGDLDLDAATEIAESVD